MTKLRAVETVLTQMPLGQIMELASSALNQAQAQMNAQLAMQRVWNQGQGYSSGTNLANPLANYRRVRHLTDAELERRYAKLTIDLEAKHK